MNNKDIKEEKVYCSCGMEMDIYELSHCYYCECPKRSIFSFKNLITFSFFRHERKIYVKRLAK